jgi:hypothetical protein
MMFTIYHIFGRIVESKDAFRQMKRWHFDNCGEV